MHKNDFKDEYGYRITFSNKNNAQKSIRYYCYNIKQMKILKKKLKEDRKALKTEIYTCEDILNKKEKDEY
jgi:hypothetical protein